MRTDHHRRAATLAVALASGLAALGGSYAVVGRTPAFVAAPVSRAVTALTPDAVLTWAIQTLGSLGQQLAFLAALVLTVALFAAPTALALGLGERLATRLDGDWLSPRVATLAVAVGGTAVLAALLAGSLGSALGTVAGAALVVVLASVPLDAIEPVSLARRRVLRAGAAGVGVAALGALLGGRTDEGTAETASVGGPEGTLLELAAQRSLAIDGIDRLVTEIGPFYRVDINSVDPTVAPEDWSLRLTGAVESEATIDFDDLLAYEPEYRFVTLRCVGEPLNGQKMDNALWTGVPVTDVLADMTGDADLPDQCCVMLWAADDYYEEFPLSALEDAVLAYRMNGQPLPRGHGAPVRALVPGHWGEINVKWLTEIEILDRPAEGYWEERGWHGTGPVETVAKLHTVNRLDDGRIEVGGHAYAGTRGISRVEVSTDGGETWTDAELSERLPGAVRGDRSLRETAQDAWRQWRHVYEAGEPHDVVVRATDAEGRLQPSEERPAFPRGATGWVSQTVRP
jgi:DMSO/TMAO reductase YedYZ molybdopterin-dependent catalytic subunit